MSKVEADKKTIAIQKLESELYRLAESLAQTQLLIKQKQSELLRLRGTLKKEGRQ